MIAGLTLLKSTQYWTAIAQLFELFETRLTYNFGNAALSAGEAELYKPNAWRTACAEPTVLSEPVNEPLLKPTALKLDCEELATPADSCAL